ncbi:putative elongation factor Tu GTP-binding domain-containing protein 1 [Apostichopus japonicus]|uniref:Elongation factor-like 1 n=1 Tax=Stichopus japonicus TaxID=307972 RepID=A0A2G8K852_STIJA|nr:putative elongation factor Tu GTP-binding domain-containing protein 1 [Apostichopus japonicus]
MRVMKGAQAKGKKPLFVQFVLENLWAVYDAVILNSDKNKTEKIIKSLDIKLGPRELKQQDTKLQLKAILNKWLPVTTCALNMVCLQLPNPTEMSEKRIEKLLCSSGRRFDSLPENSQKLKAGFQNLQGSANSPVVAFISKMFAIDKKFLPRNKQRPLTTEQIAQRRQEVRRLHQERQNLTRSQNSDEIMDETTKSSLIENGKNETGGEEEDTTENDENNGQVFIAFARIFSGVIRKGQKMYVMGPQYDPQEGLKEEEDGEWRKHIHEVIVTDLYLLMGRDLEDVDEVPAGNVFGMGGLEDIVYKSGTVSSTLACPAFTDMNFAAKPIVRVAVEPKHLSDMPILINGMKLLNQADSSVEVFVQETGEHVLVAAGEVHLGKCLKDLRERFALIELDVSVPIVPFRETVIPQPKLDMVNEVIGDVNTVQIPKQFLEELQTEGAEVTKDGGIQVITPNKIHKFRLRALPLPSTVVALLESHAELLQILDSRSTAMLTGKVETGKSHILNQKTIARLEGLKQVLSSSFDEAGRKWKGVCDKIWSFGPRRCGPNILVNSVPGYERPSIWNCLRDAKETDPSVVRDFDSCIVGGFQLVTLSGPMCDEPMMGVCFVMESWEVKEKGSEKRPTNVKSRKRNYLPANAEKSNNKPNLGSSETSKQSGECERPESERNERIDLHQDVEVMTSELQGNTGRSLATSSKTEEERGLTQSQESVKCSSELRKDENVSWSTDISGDDLSKTETIPDTESAACKQSNETPDEENEGLVSTERESTTVDRGNSYDAKRNSRWESSNLQVYGPTSGQIISTIKEGCRAAFQVQPQRLMAAMYKCNIQATADVLGKSLYSVVGKRFGKVLQEEMREGSAIFDILTTLPVAESFGFPEEIRKKTSGLASPQLFFSHWEVVPGDPYWVPSTEEELLHFGDKADSVSQARRYIDGVRRRKGLHVREHIVEHAEKQRTLSKNK